MVLVWLPVSWSLVTSFFSRCTVVDVDRQEALPCDLLVIPRMHSATVHSRSFVYMYVSPSAWNCVPQSVPLKLLSLSPLQLRKRLRNFMFAGPSTDAS